MMSSTLRVYRLVGVLLLLMIISRVIFSVADARTSNDFREKEVQIERGVDSQLACGIQAMCARGIWRVYMDGSENPLFLAPSRCEDCGDRFRVVNEADPRVSRLYINGSSAQRLGGLYFCESDACLDRRNRYTTVVYNVTVVPSHDCQLRLKVASGKSAEIYTAKGRDNIINVQEHDNITVLCLDGAEAKVRPNCDRGERGNESLIIRMPLQSSCRIRCVKLIAKGLRCRVFFQLTPSDGHRIETTTQDVTLTTGGTSSIGAGAVTVLRHPTADEDPQELEPLKTQTVPNHRLHGNTDNVDSLYYTGEKSTQSSTGYIFLAVSVTILACTNVVWLLHSVINKRRESTESKDSETLTVDPIYATINKPTR